MRSRASFTVRAAAWLLAVAGVAAGVGCELVTGLNGLQADGTGGGSGGPCSADDQCDDRNLCTKDTCGPQGTCVSTVLPDGVPGEAQTPGDCKTVRCEMGIPTVEPDNTDIPDDGNDCTVDSCNKGVPSNIAKPDDTPCTVGGNAGACSNGKCVIGCTDSASCPPLAPPMDACTTPTCDGSVGKCVYPPLPDGMPTPGFNQVAGDCKVHVCMGGADTVVNDDSDVPKTATDCDDEVCSGGTPENPPHVAGSPCSTFNGSQQGFCDGLGTCVECTQDNECPGTTDDCKHPACNGNKCGMSFQPNGVVVSMQTPGDCQRIVCDGMGGTLSIADNTDTPNDNNVCTHDLCTAGVPSHTPNPGVMCSGTTTNPELCNAQGQCGCMSNTDCTAPNTCGGGNPGTSGICGCTKATCASLNKTCGTVSDGCFSNLGCNDATKDGDETDVDCGGSNTCATRCAQGKKCNATSDCQSGLSCVDGVCCNSACTGACQACSAAKKGSGADGVCGAIKLGADPDNECPAMPASSCGNKGGCSGAGACTQWSVGTTCAGATCANTTTVQKASTCTAPNTCTAPTPPTQGCGAYLCASGACTTSCNVDPDCAPGEYCSAGHQCVAKLTTGMSGCTAGSQCLGGVCAGNVCCSGPCPDQGAASCGTDGVCAPGTGACQFYSSSTSCSSVSCTNAILTTYTSCDGMGSCAGDVTVGNCPGNLQCNTAMTACLSSCSQPSDCIGGYTCSGGSCLKAPGQMCTANSECAGNQCLGNVCCGSCTLNPTCGATACVAGTGACVYPAPDTVCMQGICAGNALFSLGVCDGAGTCTVEASFTCPNNKCTPSGCASCTADAQCGPYGYCSVTSCQPRQVAGTMCMVSNQCVSGNCLSNLCQ